MKPYYQHAGITIYHSDCRESYPLAAGLLVTDPPYGMNERTMRKSNGRGKRMGLLKCTVPPDSRDWSPVYGDDEPFDPGPWLAYPKVALFGAIHFSERLPSSRGWIVWDKRECTASDDNADCDFAWTNQNFPARLHSQLWRGICKSGEENVSISGGLVHPTQKPVALMGVVIRSLKPHRDDVLLDPYMGSGTTLLAAKRLQLRAIGIEIEEKYCEIAAKRLSQEVLEFT